MSDRDTATQWAVWQWQWWQCRQHHRHNHSWSTVEHSQYFILFHFNLFSYNNLSSSCGSKELNSQLEPVSGAAEKGKSLAQTELFKDPQKTHKPWVRVGRGYGFARVQPVPETVRTMTRKPRVYPNPCHALSLFAW